MGTVKLVVATMVVALAGCGVVPAKQSAKVLCEANGMGDGFYALGYVEAVKYLDLGRDEQSIFENTAALCDEYCLGGEASCETACRSCAFAVAEEVVAAGVDQPPSASEVCTGYGLGDEFVEAFKSLVRPLRDAGYSELEIIGELDDVCDETCSPENCEAVLGECTDAELIECTARCIQCDILIVAEVFDEG